MSAVDSAFRRLTVGQLTLNRAEWRRDRRLRPLRRTTKQQERGFISRQILRRRALHRSLPSVVVPRVAASAWAPRWHQNAHYVRPVVRPSEN
jgi:hypothetical protein